MSLNHSKDSKNIRHNIPISSSLLHEQEYYNVCHLLHKIKNVNKHRSLSETNETTKTKLQDKQVSQSPIFKSSIRQGSFNNKRQALLF